MRNLSILDSALDTKSILTTWYDESKDLNCGALITFVGIVREENGISALSFDIYEPLLCAWFDEWCLRAKKRGATVFMAHSRGDVKVHESSYIAAVLSPQRDVGLKLIAEFVEDFKANAPIWKYDVVDGVRIYAKERSKKLQNAGLLG